MMSQGVVIKVILDHEIRRITFNNAPTWKEFSDRTASLYPMLTGGIKKAYYADEDADVVTLNTDAELQEAINMARATHSKLRLYLNKEEAVAASLEDLFPPMPPSDSEGQEEKPKRATQPPQLYKSTSSKPPSRHF